MSMTRDYWKENMREEYFLLEHKIYLMEGSMRFRNLTKEESEDLKKWKYRYKVLKDVFED